jgi:hypothetical protein
MSAIEELAEMLDGMRSRKAELSGMESVLGDISAALGDVCAWLDKPDDEKGEAEAIGAAIRDALKGLQFPVNVNVQPTPVNVHPAQVTVQAPNVTVQAPAPMQSVTGWKLTVTSRDGNGAIREILFKPEN